MLNFAADLGIAAADVTQYMWICEEALAPAVLGDWQPHVDEQGAQLLRVEGASMSTYLKNIEE